MRRWLTWVVTVAVWSIVIHVAAVWAVPRLIMSTVLDRATEAASGTNVFLHAPRATAQARTIVRPSPDLSYSICIADVSGGPVRISAPVSEPYTSVSVFAANSDNLFALNDRDTSGQPIELTLAGLDQPAPEGAPIVRLPSNRAVILVRRVIKDDAHLSVLDPIRRQARCGAS